MTTQKKDINDVLAEHFEREERDAEAGARWFVSYKKEPITASFKRLLNALRSCFTEPFRQSKTVSTKLWPGHPYYEKAVSGQLGRSIAKKLLSKPNPWLTLLSKDDQ